jgi:hypothetical protein
MLDHVNDKVKGIMSQETKQKPFSENNAFAFFSFAVDHGVLFILFLYLHVLTNVNCLLPVLW